MWDVIITGRDKSQSLGDSDNIEVKDEGIPKIETPDGNKECGLPSDLGMLSFTSARTLVLNYLCGNIPDLYTITQVQLIINILV